MFPLSQKPCVLRPAFRQFESALMAITPDPSQRGLASSSPALTGNLLGIGSMVAWASAFPAAEFLLQDWSPLPLTAARLTLAVVFLIPVWAVLDGPHALVRARWGRGLVVGSIGFGLGAWMLLQAQRLSDPITVALIASCAPLAGTLLEVASRQRRLTGRFALGMGISVLGGILATNALAPGAFGWGAVLALASVFVFAWGSDRAVRDFPDLSPTGRTTITFSGALVAIGALCLGAAFLGYDGAISVNPKPAHLWPLLIYALVSMAISQALWIGSVGRLGVAVASFHINVAPFYVMILMFALGHGWDWTKASGAAIVALGVVVAQSRRRARVSPVGTVVSGRE